MIFNFCAMSDSVYIAGYPHAPSQNEILKKNNHTDLQRAKQKDERDTSNKKRSMARSILDCHF